MKKGRIFEIKRFAVHDGDGIRTTVFFKGCPLRCVWCHNPEGLLAEAQLAFFEHKCVGCGSCIDVCPVSAHLLRDGKHYFDRILCIACGKCEDVCIGEALKVYGKEYGIDELMDILIEDRDFYDATGGGVTLSGGECLCQVDFCEELLKLLKKQGINTAVDTCGAVSKKALDRVIPFTDTFLYDIKAFDEDVHIKCTGASNSKVIDNIMYLDSLGKSIEIRIPYVPEYNSSQIKKIYEFLRILKNIRSVKILPYHNYADSKYLALGMKNTLPNRIPNEAELDMVRNIFDSLNNKNIDP